MSEKFTQFTVKSEPKGMGDSRVVKMENPGAPTVVDYSMAPIREPGTGTYADTRRKYGPLAATDTGRVARARKDARFSLNPLLRDPLAVEEEERRVIEEKVRGRVNAIADETREKGLSAGREEGLRQGHEEAFKSFREEASGRLQSFDALLKDMEEAKSKIFAENERFIIEMVCRLSRSVLLRELATDKEYILRLARELVERAGVRENIRVKIHPNDMASAAMIKEGLDVALGGLKNLTIEASPQVRGGGCIVETEWNAIDASLDTQLEGLYKGLIPDDSNSESEV